MLEEVVRSKLVILFISVIVLTCLAGCSAEADGDLASGGSTVIWVTRDFGTEEIASFEADVGEGNNVMELLQKHLNVETEYGGGFVNAIEGLESGYTGKASEEQRMQDWFFYINGILSGVGAPDYVPADKDVIWWDYHPWGEISFTPAVIGAFPQPFLNGYRGNNPGTLILAGTGCSEAGRRLAVFLQEKGVMQVEVLPYEEARASARSRMTIVLAPWEELNGSSFWKGIQENRDKTGWFAELTPEAFYRLDMHGQRVEEYRDSAAAILATGTGMGDASALWLFTALDKEGVSEIVEMTVQRTEELQGKTGALLVGKEVIALPAKR